MADGITIKNSGSAMSAPSIDAARTASKNVNTVGDNLEAHAPHYQNTRQNVGTTGASAKMPGFKDIILVARSERPLTPEGKKYLERLTEILCTPEKNIKLVRLPQTNAYLFHRDGKGFGIVFKEHIPAQNNLKPASTYNEKVYREIQERYQGIDVLDVVDIHSTDYICVDNMGRHIEAVLTYALDSNAAMGFNAIIDKNNIFRVVTNIHTVNQAISEVSPHGVPANVKVGFTLDICTSQDINPYKFNNPRDTDNYDWTTIFAVGAYVDFSKLNNFATDGPQYTPLVHISEITSLIPTPRILPIVLALATDTFLGKGLWKEAVSSYTGQPNIGSLIITADGVVQSVSNIGDREEFINKFCTPAVLCLDALDGRASIPGLNLFAIPNGNSILASCFNEFFNMNMLNQGMSLTLDTYEEFTGIVRTGSMDKDSRSLDYFEMINAAGGNRQLLDRFLIRDGRPNQRLLDLQEAGFTSIVPMYQNNMCILNPEAMLAFCSAVGQQMPVLSELTNNFNGMNMNVLRDIGQRFATGFQNAPGGMFNAPFSGRSFGGTNYRQNAFGASYGARYTFK